MCVLSIKVAIRKKSGNLFSDPRIFFFSPLQENLKSYISFPFKDFKSFKRTKNKYHSFEEFLEY